MNDQNLAVLTNIIGAVESGGQIYGKRRYDAYDPPYKNSSKEHTITIGWYQAYGHEARQLMQAIYDADVFNFWKCDTADIEDMLRYDWVALKWKPTAKQKAAIIAIIDSEVGRKVQDAIFTDKMQKLIEDCANTYTTDVRAQMMYCEIRHLGGKAPCDRIFKRCAGNYDLDNIMAALVADQKDTSSDNQVGDKKYWSRHVKCRTFIENYAIDESEPNEEHMTEEQAIDRVIAIAEEEVGYHEKQSNKDLYDKTKNSGNQNWTKYGKEMHDLQPSNMDVGSAWCDTFVDFCFYKAFGAEIARKMLCGNFDDYTPNSANLYKKKNRWTETPRRGYQAFFQNHERICHTGLVYHTNGKVFYTIEGNANNEVRKKQYTIGDPYVAGFGMPLYSEATTLAPSDGSDSSASKKDTVKLFQTFMNNNYTNVLKKAGIGQLKVDGDYGSITRSAALAIWKYMADKYYSATLTIGNNNFLGASQQTAEKMTNTECDKHPTLAYLLQGILAGRGFYSGELDAIIGTQTKSAIKKLQSKYDLAASGEMTGQTWYALFN